MATSSIISALTAISSNSISQLGTAQRARSTGTLGATRQSTTGAIRGGSTLGVQSSGGLVASQFRAVAARVGLSQLQEKLNTLDAAAGKLTLNSGSVFQEGGSAWSSNSKIVQIDAAPTNLSSPLEVNVLQLANTATGQQAIIEINGEQFSSSTNQFVDAGGIEGLNLTALRTTATTVSSTTVTPGTTTNTFSDSVAIESFSSSNNKLRSDDDVTFETGDAVQVFGTGVGGVSEGTTYYARVEEGWDIRLYDTQANALSGGSQGRVSLTGGGSGWKDVSGVSIAKVTTTTTADVTTTTVTKLTDDPVTIRRTASPTDVAVAIRNYVAAYNDVQDFLANNTGPEGALDGERQVGRLQSQLRRSIGAFFHKASLDGIATENKSGQINFDNEQLEAAMSSNFTAVARAFTDAPNGIAARTETAIEPFIGSQGILAQRSMALGETLKTADTKAVRAAEKQLNSTSNSLNSIAGAMLSVQQQTGFLSSLTSRLL